MMTLKIVFHKKPKNKVLTELIDGSIQSGSSKI